MLESTFAVDDKPLHNNEQIQRTTIKANGQNEKLRKTLVEKGIKQLRQKASKAIQSDRPTTLPKNAE